MRLGTYRDKLKRMQNHVSCLQSKAKQLLREQDDVQLQLDVFEGLIAARDAWANVCKSVLEPEWESDELLQLTMEGADRQLQELLRERTHTPEHVLQQLPMLPALSLIDSALHDSVSRLTPDAAAKQWMSFVQDTASLLTLFELHPEMASPLLTAHTAHIIAWLLCLYFFNTRVAFELHGINLLTGDATPAPEGHWVRAFEAAAFTEQQRRHIAIANQFCEPRLSQLQHEQRQLQRQLAKLHGHQHGTGPSSSSGTSSGCADPTGSLSASGSQPSDPSLTAHCEALPRGSRRRGSGRGGAGPGDAAGPGADSGAKVEPDAVAVKEEALYGDKAASRPTPSPATAAAGSGSGAAPGSGETPGAAAAAAGAQAALGLSRSDSGDGSNHARQKQLAQANELTHKVSANCRTWRIVTSMRAQYSVAVMTPWQVARLAVAASPYLLIGAPIYDEIMSSKQGVPSN